MEQIWENQLIRVAIRCTTIQGECIRTGKGSAGNVDAMFQRIQLRGT
jgi:hypothetical protein